MEFLKVLWNNLVKGPVTEPFPPAPVLTPKRLRAQVVLDPDLCVGCGMCKHVCTAGAISITVRPDSSGYDFTVWRNTCCLCAQCRHYCPTKAITLSNNWHTAHRSEHTYTTVEHHFIKYQRCEKCGAKLRFLPDSIYAKLYENMAEIEGMPDVRHLCPKCRQIATALSEDRACHINHLQDLAQDGKACLLTDSDKTQPPTQEPEETPNA